MSLRTAECYLVNTISEFLWVRSSQVAELCGSGIPDDVAVKILAGTVVI